MNTCSFSYTGVRTKQLCRATGVERTGEYLQREFNRDGEPLPGAKYYETIGAGPQVFAVANGQVYYYQDKKWVQYTTAFDVTSGNIAIND